MRWVSAVILSTMLGALACGDDGPTVLDSWPEECGGNPYLGKAPDHIAIANEIMAESSDEPLFDEGKRNALAGEIEDVLRIMRNDLPSRTEVSVPPYPIPQVTIGLRGDAAARMLDMEYTNDALVVRRTGDRSIDLVGRELGLRAVRVSAYRDPDRASAGLCLSDLVNPEPAARLFESIDDVEYSEVAGYYWIGWVPGINMRKSGNTWHVATITPKGGGGCRVLCSDPEVTYYRVDGDNVVVVPPDEAAEDEIFARVAKLAQIGFAGESEEPPAED